MTKKTSILFVDDETEITEIFTEYLNNFNEFEIRTAPNGLVGLELYKQKSADILITDVDMPELNGLDLITKISLLNNTLKAIIIITGKQSSAVRESLSRANSKLPPLVFMAKPFSPKQILNEIRELI